MPEEEERKDLWLELLEISEDLHFISNTMVGSRVRELRAYAARLASLANDRVRPATAIHSIPTSTGATLEH